MSKHLESLEPNSNRAPGSHTHSPVDGHAPTQYSTLGRSITGWTSNLLATGIVLVVAFVLGSTLVGIYFPEDQNSDSAAFLLEDAWPTLESCSLQFGDAPFTLQRKSFAGNRADVVEFLSSCCQQKIQQGVEPVGPLGRAEALLVERSQHRMPLASAAGKWRVFNQSANSSENPLPLVVGIRDDIQGSADPSQVENETSSRLVVWGIAMPLDEGKNWTTYIGTASELETAEELKRLIPPGASPTLTIADHHGGILLGFSGGETNSTIQFFDTLASDRGWESKRNWQTINSWQAQFELDDDSNFTGIHIQLDANHTEVTRGILVLKTRDAAATPISRK